MLCRHMAEWPEAWRHKSVLELGAGVGLCGFVNARLFGGFSAGRRVVLTDGQDAALALLARNCKLAGLEEEVFVQRLQWGVSAGPSVDAVFASDCIYSLDAAEQVLATVGQVGASSLLLGSPMRSAHLWESVAGLARALGLHLVEPRTLPEGSELERVRKKGVLVLRFERIDLHALD